MTQTTDSWESLLAEQAREHGRYFYRVAYGILRHATAAEDACQQAMLKACQQESELRQVHHLRAWLTRVVINESLQQLRKRRREHTALTQREYRFPSAATWDPGGELALREHIEHALETLTEPTRSVVVLRLMNGFTGNEVKDMLACSAVEVSRRLHAGMEQLRSVLTRQESKV